VADRCATCRTPLCTGPLWTVYEYVSCNPYPWPPDPAVPTVDHQSVGRLVLLYIGTLNGQFCSFCLKPWVKQGQFCRGVRIEQCGLLIFGQIQYLGLIESGLLLHGLTKRCGTVVGTPVHHGLTDRRVDAAEQWDCQTLVP